MTNSKNEINNNFTVFFGNKNNCTVSHKSKEFESFSKKLVQEHGLEKLVFQKQVHGTAGIYIDFKKKAEYVQPSDRTILELEGDFLITNQKNIGIGVLTADCLPIIFYDTKNHVAACIHAGWRSSVAEICTKAIQLMFAKFKFAPKDLQIYFGPCAKACCYQVQPDFLDNLKNFKFKSQVIRRVRTNNAGDQKTGNQFFFDNVLFNKLLLIDLGMISKNMHFENNHCTICNSNFHSYRKDSENALRQISFIVLK
jgi:polyphenol oxidase